jgi:hypothetical protein
MKHALVFAAVLLSLVLSCGQKPATKPETPKPNPGQSLEFMLQSFAFPDNDRIPERYTGYGADVSPALKWSNPPNGVRSWALILEDPDAPIGTFSHWLIYDLPGEETSLPEGLPRDQILPDGSRQLKNDFGKFGYNGPKPPPGKLHHYQFQLYALDQMLAASIANKKQLRDAMQGHVLGQTRLTGVYQR